MLAELSSQIAEACRGPAATLSQRIIACLQVATRDPLLLPYVQKPSDPKNYIRYLLHEDPEGRFSIFSLVWNKGQITPVHGHNFWCAYGVVSGTLTENFYAYDAAVNKAKRRGIYQRAPGYACFHEAGLDIVHRLSNTGVEQAISLHVYGTVGAEPRRQVSREVSNFAGAKHINRLVEAE